MKKEDTVVLVGWGMGTANQNMVLAALKAADYSALPVEVNWPRDKYVSHKGVYFLYDHDGAYAEGGMIRNGSESIVYSDGDIFEAISGEGFLRTDLPSHIISKEKDQLRKRMETKYKTQVMLMPADTRRHIDYFTLMLEKEGEIVVDINEGKNALIDDTVYKEAEMVGMKIVEYDPQNVERFYPLNAAVLPGNGKETIIIDSEFEDLNELLQNKGYDVVPTFLDSSHWAGSLNCVTNIVHKKDLSYIMDKLNLDPDYNIESDLR